MSSSFVALVLVRRWTPTGRGYLTEPGTNWGVKDTSHVSDFPLTEEWGLDSKAWCSYYGEEERGCWEQLTILNDIKRDVDQTYLTVDMLALAINLSFIVPIVLEQKKFLTITVLEFYSKLVMNLEPFT